MRLIDLQSQDLLFTVHSFLNSSYFMASVTIREYAVNAYYLFVCTTKGLYLFVVLFTEHNKNSFFTNSSLLSILSLVCCCIHVQKCQVLGKALDRVTLVQSVALGTVNRYL